MNLMEIRVLTAAFRSFRTPNLGECQAIDRLISRPNINPGLAMMIRSAGQSDVRQAATITWRKCVEHVAEQLSDKEFGIGIDKDLFIRACCEPVPISDPAPGYSYEECTSKPEFGYPYR